MYNDFVNSRRKQHMIGILIAMRSATLSLYNLYNMGFVGVREDSSNEDASVILNMLLKFGGVLICNDDKRSLVFQTSKVILF